MFCILSRILSLAELRGLLPLSVEPRVWKVAWRLPAKFPHRRFYGRMYWSSTAGVLKWTAPNLTCQIGCGTYVTAHSSYSIMIGRGTTQELLTLYLSILPSQRRIGEAPNE